MVGEGGFSRSRRGAVAIEMGEDCRGGSKRGYSGTKQPVTRWGIINASLKLNLKI